MEERARLEPKASLEAALEQVCVRMTEDAELVSRINNMYPLQKGAQWQSATGATLER